MGYRKRRSAFRNGGHWQEDTCMSPTRIIKKYPNRRLYDTEESRYITLTDVKELILSDAKLKVIDKKTGDDITRTILLQVISEQEQNGNAIMNEGFLIQVIRSYGSMGTNQLAEHLTHSLRAFIAQSPDFSDDNEPGKYPHQPKNSLTSGP
jgi:polyhydroxyalkanoate synthesis repressor PhaR